MSGRSHLNVVIAVAMAGRFVVSTACGLPGNEPHIVTHPTSRIAVPGETIVLGVEASGATPLAYHWSFDGRSVDSSNGTELVLENVTPAQTGDYAVTVFNDFGVAESAIARVTVAEGADIEFSDSFDSRPLLQGAHGIAIGDNFGATWEEEEPEHGHHKGRRSVWVSWIAPADGIATFSSDGSDFDTILAVYADESFLEDHPEHDVGDPPIKRLEEVTENDDGRLTNTSFVQFVAKGGVPYEIAIDGYAGATGNIVLGWNFMALGSPLPVILQLPADRSVRVGDVLELTIGVDVASEVEFRWLRDGREVDGAESATLRIRDFSLGDLGRYQLRIRGEGFSITTAPIEIQINTEGRADALAHDKLEAAVASPLSANPGTAASVAANSSGQGGLGLGLARGFSGSQIFETLFATKDPMEPDHCGVKGGASYWFAIEPAEPGRLSVDTLGSDFDTVLAVYTSAGVASDYASLVQVDCNDNADGQTLSSSVTFDAQGSRRYFVVVDGVDGARGKVRLNYVFENLAGVLVESLDFKMLRPGSGGTPLRLAYKPVDGYEVVIEARSNWMDGTWRRIDTTGAVVGQDRHYLEVSISDATTRFYRVRLIPDGTVTSQ